MGMDGQDAPIIVGGVGGSGTRLIAQILIDCDAYLGTDLNRQRDNLWFTLLFRRPKWYQQATADMVLTTLQCFDRIIRHKPLTDDDWTTIQAAADEMAEHSWHLHWTQDRQWVNERITTIRNTRDQRIKTQRWGWKEPNAYIYLPSLTDLYPQMRYIHVMRHGLDMAYSNNQNQVHNWGFLANQFPSPWRAVSPQESLTWWLYANERAIQYGRENLKDRFYLLNFDEICRNPEQEITQLLTFLQIDKNTVDLEALSALPRIPSSLGRHQKHALTDFRAHSIDQTKALGFEVADSLQWHDQRHNIRRLMSGVSCWVKPQAPRFTKEAKRLLKRAIR